MPTTTLATITASIDAVAARTDSAGTPVSPDWKAEERRIGNMILSEGVITPNAGFKVVAGAGGTMNVVVGSGSAEVDIACVEGIDPGQGNYLVRLDDVTKTITLAAALVGDSRVDEIYLVVRDNAYDSASRTLPYLAVRQGDAGGAAPGPDAGWKSYLKLASISIPAAAPDILACTITDNRVYSGIAMQFGGLVPTGALTQYAGVSAPEGYLLCDGTAVSRTTYARLFAIIGTTYGVGDGSTTFGLPDLRQRFPLGKAASGTGSVLGSTGGAIDHTHTGPSHTHTGPSHTHSVNVASTTTSSDGSHSHTTNAPIGDFQTLYQTIASADISDVEDHTHTTNSTGAHTHTVDPASVTSGSGGTGNTGASGTGATGSANPPYLVLNYIIKT